MDPLVLPKEVVVEPIAISKPVLAKDVSVADQAIEVSKSKRGGTPGRRGDGPEGIP